MKRFLAFLFLLWTFAGGAADTYVSFTLSITNVPVTSNTITINGNARRWTNATTLNTILTNAAGINQSTTNLFNALGAFPERAVLISWVETNQIHFEGTNLNLSFATAWAAISSGSTGTLSTSYAFMFPFDRLSATNRTNNASELAYGISKYSTNPILGMRITNVVGLNGTVNRLTNGNYKTPILESPTQTNGYSTNAILDRPFTTNLVNRGSAISSIGSATGAEQLGTGATATNLTALAVGASALAGGVQATALGNAASALGDSSIAIGKDSATYVSAGNAISIGVDSIAGTNDAIAIGSAAVVTNIGGVAIGSSAASTADYQIRLGTAAFTVDVPGRIVSDSHTNNTLTGTNVVKGDLSFTRFDNSGLANGNNAAILIGTNYFMNVSGPTAAFACNGFQGGRNGKSFVLQKTNSLTMTIANDSGVDPTAANRILTGTGADVTVTNNPGYVQFIYNADLARWGILSKSN